MANSKVVIKGARVIDVKNGKVIEQGVVVVDGNSIMAVGRDGDVQIPQGARVIDAKGCTLLPGLFDAVCSIAALNPLTFNNYRVATFEITPHYNRSTRCFMPRWRSKWASPTLRDLGRLTPRGLMTEEICASARRHRDGHHRRPALARSRPRRDRQLASRSHHPARGPSACPAIPPTGLIRCARWCASNCAWVATSSRPASPAAADRQGRARRAQYDAGGARRHRRRGARLPPSRCRRTASPPKSHRMCVRSKVDTIEHIVFTDDDTIKMIVDADIPVIPTLLHRTDEAIESRGAHGTRISSSRR